MIRDMIRKATCRHHRLDFDGGSLQHLAGAQVGVEMTVRCPECGRRWSQGFLTHFTPLADAQEQLEVARIRASRAEAGFESVRESLVREQRRRPRQADTDTDTDADAATDADTDTDADTESGHSSGQRGSVVVSPEGERPRITKQTGPKLSGAAAKPSRKNWSDQGVDPDTDPIIDSELVEARAELGDRWEVVRIGVFLQAVPRTGERRVIRETNVQTLVMRARSG